MVTIEQASQSIGHSWRCCHFADEQIDWLVIWTNGEGPS